MGLRARYFINFGTTLVVSSEGLTFSFFGFAQLHPYQALLYFLPLSFWIDVSRGAFCAQGSSVAILANEKNTIHIGKKA